MDSSSPAGMPRADYWLPAHAFHPNSTRAPPFVRSAHFTLNPSRIAITQLLRGTSRSAVVLDGSCFRNFHVFEDRCTEYKRRLGHSYQYAFKSGECQGRVSSASDADKGFTNAVISSTVTNAAIATQTNTNNGFNHDKRNGTPLASTWADMRWITVS